MQILAIDPGPVLSSWVWWNQPHVESGTVANRDMHSVWLLRGSPVTVIEMPEGRGGIAGQETFDTCVWVGRFAERFCTNALVYRRVVKLHLCGTSRAKDAQIRQAIIDRLGSPGTKRNPGATFGVKGGEWQALALALTWFDQTTDERL